MIRVHEYKFQFDSDEASCLALIALIHRGWVVEGFRIEDGYSWLIMRNEITDY